MATNFPGSADDGTTLPNPTAVNKTNSPSHSSIHSNGNDAIKAIEAKLGTGASAPTNNTLLRGNGTGTSTWATLTSAQLAASLSDETGSGASVFATSPTLVTPSVNTINESTPTNGVTIDGLNIKDSALNTNNSVVTSNITDASVTNPKLQNTGVFNSSWAWTTYAPTLTNLSGGSVTLAKYAVFGKTVTVRFRYVLAGAGVSGIVGVSLPFTAAASYSTNNPVGIGIFLDTGVASYDACLLMGSTTRVDVFAKIASGTYVSATNVSSTVPFTFGANDVIEFLMNYEAA